MESGFFSFVWKHSKRDQLIILSLTLISFPLVYLSLEVPKTIINEAISGTDFPKNIFGFDVEQIPYLLLLCGLYLALIVAINGIKWLMNIQIGMTGERMLRRLRYMLFERVMRFRIARFRSTKPGEVIQSIMGEIEPLGGFIGEVLATPCFQGGLLVVYCSFIFVQDWVLGLAAISLYPLQAYVIPILQRKIVRLNKERAANSRLLADTIGETVNVISEVHTNNTARWHMAQVAGRLYENTAIRLQLFRRKFTIKFLNNFLNHLTPFFFYSAGGYLVIKGDLDFGSLVAVLAAYKDVAAPWKAVLTYFQRWSDFNSRFEFVVENFSGEDVLPEARVYRAPDPSQPLVGALEFNGVEGGPGTAGLTVRRISVAPGQMVAVMGGQSGGREALLKLAAGLMPPAGGTVGIGGRSLSDCSMAEIGEAIAYVGPEPGVIARPIRDNLLYGLFDELPDLGTQDRADLSEMLREARLTGNTTADPEGNWINYARAGVDGPEGLTDRLMHLIHVVGLSEELYTLALLSRFNPDSTTELTDLVLTARETLMHQGEEAQKVFADIVEMWVPEVFNTNGNLLENTIYALPIHARDEPGDYYDDPAVREILAESNAISLLCEIGLDIAREFSELADAAGESSSVLDNLAGFSRSDVLEAHAFITARASRGRTPTRMTDEQERMLIRLALSYVDMRDRLDVLSEERIAAILTCRGNARALIKDRDDFVSFDRAAFSPARTVSGNIFHGKRRNDRRAAWRTLERMVRDAVDEAGLTESVLELGLDRTVSSGSGLSTSTRRRMALVRALMKRPQFLILDGIAASDSEEDARLRAAIRAELPTAAILYTAAEAGAAEGADDVINIDENGDAVCDDR